MKKFLSLALVAIMLVASVAVTASAVDFVAGAGYDLYSGASYSEAVNEGKAPNTMTVNDDGSVTVEQSGYYKDPKGDENFGGVATAEKVGLNGLVVEIAFDEVPAVTSGSDCWFGLHLMAQPKVFNTGDIPGNPGYIPLIRFNRPNVEFYEGVTAFSGTGSTEINPNIFGFKAGDVLKMSVKYELGQFMITYDHNGETYEVPADKTLAASDAVFADGTAYVVVTGTCLGLESNWKYTVKVTEGAALTEEEIASKAFEQSKKAAADVVAESLEDAKSALEDAKELAGDMDDAEVLDAIAAIEAAIVEAEAADADIIAAADEAAVAAAQEKAVAAKNAATGAVDTIEAYIEMMGDEEAEEPAEDEAPAADEAPAVDEAPEETEGVNVGLIIAIIAIVVVVVVVLAVVLKKKKN